MPVFKLLKLGCFQKIKNFLHTWQLITMQTKSGPMYQARLSAKFGCKTIGLGSDLIQTLYLAQIIDEMIKEFIVKNQPVDIGIIKRAVNEIKKSGIQSKDDRLLRIKVVDKVDTPRTKVAWIRY